MVLAEHVRDRAPHSVCDCGRDQRPAGAVRVAGFHELVDQDLEPARIDVATFKERFGVTRKFAIPLLEYLDRERVTRRVGDARVVL